MATQAEIEAILKLKDELSGKLKTVEANLQSATQKNSGLIAGLGNTQISFAAVAAAGAVVVGSFAAVTGAAGAAVNSIVSFAGPLSDLASKTATSTEFLQLMAIAGGQVGISMDQIGTASTKLQQNIGATGEESKKVAEALGEIGLKLSDLKAMSPEQQFDAVAKAIAGIKDPATQVAVAVALFGKAGAEMLPLIRSNFEGVTAEAEKLGIILSEKVVKAADQTGDRFAILEKALGATVMQIGGAIVQSQGFQAALEQVITAVGELNQWIIANSSEIQSWVTAGILVAASAIEFTLTFVGLFVTGLGLLGETVLQVNKYFVDLAVALLNSPFAAMIPGVALFREQLVGMAEGMAKNLQGGIDFFQGVEKLGAGIDQAGVKVGDFKGNLLLQIAAGEKATQGHKAQAVAVNELGIAFKTTSDSAKMLADGMAQFDEVKHYEAIQASATAYGEEQRQIAAATAEMAPYLAAAKEQVAATEDHTVHLQALELKTIDWGKAMAGVNDFLSESRGLFDLLGVSSDSVLGKMLGWATKIFDAFNSITGILGKVMGAFSGGGGGGGGAGGILGSLLGGGGGLGSLLGLGGGAAAAGAGGAGAAAAGGAGAATGGIGGALAAIPVAGWIAAAGVGIGLLLKKFLGGKDLVRDAARDLGATIPKEMAKAIEKSGKPLQLAVGQIFESGGFPSVDRFAEEIGDIFSGVDQGKFGKADALTALNESLPQLIEHFGELGDVGKANVERILEAAGRLGIDLGAAGDQLERLSKGIPNLTLEGFQSKFDISGEQLGALGALGIPIQTEAQRIAEDLKIPLDLLTSLGPEFEKFGISIQELPDFLAATGLTFEDLVSRMGLPPELAAQWQAFQTAQSALPPPPGEPGATGTEPFDPAIFGAGAGDAIVKALGPGQAKMSGDLSSMKISLDALPAAIARAVRDAVQMGATG